VFIVVYTKLNWCVLVEVDFQCYFDVISFSTHSMIVIFDRCGLIK